MLTEILSGIILGALALIGLGILFTLICMLLIPTKKYAYVVDNFNETSQNFLLYTMFFIIDFFTIWRSSTRKQMRENLRRIKRLKFRRM